MPSKNVKNFLLYIEECIESYLLWRMLLLSDRHVSLALRDIIRQFGRSTEGLLPVTKSVYLRIIILKPDDRLQNIRI